MIRRSFAVPFRPGFIPGRKLLRVALILLAAGLWIWPWIGIARGQTPNPVPKGPAAVEAVDIPSHAEATRLVWATMIGVDQAIRSGNFSVLLDLSAPAFRERNDADGLKRAFAAMRSQNADLGRTVALTPVFLEPPALSREGVLRLVGGFGSRPVGIHFDLLFQRIDREWRMFGIALTPIVTKPIEAAPQAPR